MCITLIEMESSHSHTKTPISLSSGHVSNVISPCKPEICERGNLDVRETAVFPFQTPGNLVTILFCILFTVPRLFLLLMKIIYMI